MMPLSSVFPILHLIFEESPNFAAVVVVFVAAAVAVGAGGAALTAAAEMAAVPFPAFCWMYVRAFQDQSNRSRS